MRFIVMLLLTALFAAGCSPSETAPETKQLRGNRIPPGAGPATQH